MGIPSIFPSLRLSLFHFLFLWLAKYVESSAWNLHFDWKMELAVVEPGMKMIVWDEEQYFLKLANLWANLISHHSPELPCIKIHGS